MSKVTNLLHVSTFLFKKIKFSFFKILKFGQDLFIEIFSRNYRESCKINNCITLTSSLIYK